MNIGKLLLKYLGGKVAFQKLFVKIYNIGINGMGYRELMRSNALEKWAINYVLGKIHSKSILFDISANTEYTKEIQFVNKNFKKEILFYSFEPILKTYFVLHEKYKNNSSVFVTNVSLSNESNHNLKFNCCNNDVLYSFSNLTILEVIIFIQKLLLKKKRLKIFAR